jgi:hypothetical protein
VTLQRTLQRVFAGELIPSGVFSFRYLLNVFVTLEGSLRAYGEVHLRRVRGPWPPLSTATPSEAPLLVGAGAPTAPLAVLVQASPGAPAAMPAVKTTAPYAVPVQKPDWPPLR